MKALYVSLLAVAGILSTGFVQADEGGDLAKAKNCLSCHAADKMMVGPAYKEVAKKYAGQKDAEAMLTQSILKGTGTGKGWQKEGKAAMAMMPPNAMVKPDEAAKLAKWVLSQK
jgi:cytochrome c